MFWSGHKLKKNIELLLPNYKGGNNIDCASIALTIGNEVYITPSSDTDTKVKKILTDSNSQFIIPKGQFALLITEEIVQVPNDAIAFISFKAKYKYKGLINVSGFHVDPGWKGKLTFSVYNAGPSDVVLEKGNPFALIWYADLDKSGANEEDYKKYFVKKQDTVLNITSDKVTDMSGDIFSPFKLKKEIDEIKEKYNKEILDLRKEVNTIEGKLLIRTGLLIFTFISLIVLVIRLLPPKA
ncbi:dCTP deaminase domain-containing protein [Acinetobacter sp. WCHA45]|uniref:dCTP deaminase domain-containing protein n=1 Tax=Acinetobacter sp. WCHA45 TaxID=2004644 RepID=UPI000B3C9CD7|nr:deoxycytidine triphosphate deaminase [Acinetobacter sp. WCHA45]AVZ84669.1 deoxycytidine triphosphate deaminase [Acinetobacter sp. WCHA45]